MGNCLNPASKQLGFRGGAGEMMMTKEEEETRLSEMKRISQVLREEEAEEEEAEQAAEDEEGLKVKMVLTRAELEWLMAQLKIGERRLEDVLHHLHAVKGARAADSDCAGAGWRPSLESILECPETAAATVY